MCREEILQNLKCLITAQFQYIDRTLDLVHLGFGELIEETNRHGKKREIAAYSFHIQCPFRILKNDLIILCTEDLFLPFPKSNFEADLDKRNSTLFDFKARDATKKFKGEKIIDFTINSQNDLTIKTENLIIQLFISYTHSESWRFFAYSDNSPHIVVDEDGLNCSTNQETDQSGETNQGTVRPIRGRFYD